MKFKTLLIDTRPHQAHKADVSKALSRLKPLIENKKPYVTVFNEFTFNIVDVARSIDSIKAVAITTRCNLLLVPANKEYPNGTYENWDFAKAHLGIAGIDFEDITPPKSFIVESIGLWVDKTGRAFAFPKTLDQNGRTAYKPVHRIPGTDFAVSICSEVLSLTPESLKDVRVLFNPSLNGDDYYLLARTMFLANAKVEEILRQYHYSADSSESAFWLQRLLKRFALPSPFFPGNSEEFKHRILAIRADMGKSSGVLQLPENAILTDLELGIGSMLIGVELK